MPPRKGREQIAGSDADRLGPQVEAEISRGVPAKVACSDLGLPTTTYYRWRRARLIEEGANPERRDVVRVRQSLRDTATRLFLDEGYSLTFETLAEAANVSRQTIYNLYGNRKTLFEAIVQEIFAAMDVEAHLKNHDDPESSLLEFSKAYLRFMYDPKVIGLTRVSVAGRRAFPELTRELSRLGTLHARQTLSGYFKQLIKLGKMRRTDPEMLVDAFCGALNGHRYNRVVLGNDPVPSRQDLDATARFVTEWIVGWFLSAEPSKSTNVRV